MTKIINHGPAPRITSIVVTIRNFFGETIYQESMNYREDKIESFQESLSKQYPACNVNISWTGKDGNHCFICGMSENDKQELAQECAGIDADVDAMETKEWEENIFFHI